MSKERIEALLTPADVAERCHVSPKTVIRAIRAGRLRAYRLGTRGAYRLRASDVEAWLAESAVQAVVVPLPVRQPLPSTPPRPAPTAGGKLRVPRSVSG
jgi:excisionase family DNA binding protein